MIVQASICQCTPRLLTARSYIRPPSRGEFVKQRCYDRYALRLRELPKELTALVGQRISGVRRILYVGPDGQVGRTGAIELTSSEGTVVVLDSGADGESMRVTGQRWTDPFGEPLSPENRAWVDRVGKWSAFDVGDDPEYAALAAGTVLSVDPIYENDTVTGALVRTAGGTLRAHVEFDEMLMTVS